VLFVLGEIELLERHAFLAHVAERAPHAEAEGEVPHYAHDLDDWRGAGDHFDVDERIRREPPRRLRRGRSTENEGTHADDEESHREASTGGQLLQILKGARWSGKVRDVRIRW